MHLKSLLTPALLPLMLVALPIASLGNSAVSDSIISPAPSRALLRNEQKGKKKARSSSTAKNGKNKRRRSTPTTDKAKKRRSSSQSKVEKEAEKDAMRRKIEAEKEAKRRKSYWKSTASYIGKALRRVDKEVANAEKRKAKAEAKVKKSVTRSKVFKKNMLTCAERDILENTPVSDLACTIEQIARCRFNLNNLTSLTNRRWKQGTNCSSECPAPPSDSSWAMMGKPIVGKKNAPVVDKVGPVALSGNGQKMVTLISREREQIGVYELNKDGDWSLLQPIDLGFSYYNNELAMSDDGSRIAVGPRSESHPVQVFAKDSRTGKYTLLGKPLTEGYKDYKMNNVAISADGGTVAAIGTNTTSKLGFVRVWKWNDSAKDWDMAGEMEGSVGRTSMYEYFSLNKYGNRMAIGNSKGGDNNAGEILILDFDSEDKTWSPAANTPLQAPAGAASFGATVSMSDDGLRLVASQAKAGEQQVLAFEVDPETNEWSSQVVASRENSYFGKKISMSGDGATVVTGTPTHNGVGQGTIAIGLVEVFRVQAGGEWAQLGQGLTDNIGFGMYGYFVSVSSNGDTIATGTTFVQGGRGKVDVYQLKGAYDC